jgi:DNA polymerase
MDKMSQIKELNAKWLAECVCVLRATATQGVPGDGNVNAEIVFIGEAPGAREDKEGVPFVGSAGKFLSEMLAGINMKREDVYITNIVKYRPPENRDPSSTEITACSAWLEEEIKLIKPTLIILLGRHAMNHFFPNKKISEEHGVVSVAPLFSRRQHFLPLYHPAAALYNGSLRTVLKEDFKRIPHILKNISQEGQCDRDF